MLCNGKSGGKYLFEALVDVGLVRIHGKMTELKDGISMEDYTANLRSAERDAKNTIEAHGGAISPHGTNIRF